MYIHTHIYMRVCIYIFFIYTYNHHKLCIRVTNCVYATQTVYTSSGLHARTTYPRQQYLYTNVSIDTQIHQ